MATYDKYENLKKVVGGIRGDAAPATADGEPTALRMNSNSELIVSIGGGTGAVAVQGEDAHDEAISADPVLIGVEAADFDGAALPNAVGAEGDLVRPKASLSGIPYSMLVNEDGSATPLAPEGTAAGEGLQISLDDGTDTIFAQGDTTGNLRVVGSVAHDAIDSGDPVKTGLKAITTLPAAVANLDRVDSVGDVYGRAMDAAFELLNQANRVTQENLESDLFDDDTVVSVTDGDDDTYEYYIDMRGYKNLSLDLILDGGSGTVTVTVWAAMSNGTTAKESLNYTDVTNAAYGAGASHTADVLLLDTANFFKTVSWVMIQVVASTTGSNDADWTILKMKNKV